MKNKVKYNFSKWKFIELTAWMDGGSITLYFENQSDQKLIVDLQQHLSTEYYEEISKVLGRIYVNDKIVERRSMLEHKILDHLKQNVIRLLPVLDKSILVNKIMWIESKDYADLIPTKLALSETRKREL